MAGLGEGDARGEHLAGIAAAELAVCKAVDIQGIARHQRNQLAVGGDVEALGGHLGQRQDGVVEAVLVVDAHELGEDALGGLLDLALRVGIGLDGDGLHRHGHQVVLVHPADDGLIHVGVDAAGVELVQRQARDLFNLKALGGALRLAVGLGGALGEYERLFLRGDGAAACQQRKREQQRQQADDAFFHG